jgi:predicted metal-dependent hydrolase
MRPDFESGLSSGIRHFNSLDFWDAHESWEALWLAAESDLDQFLQGLIQVAAAYHHLQRGTFRGGVRLFDAGLARLADFPNPHCGIDRAAVESAARKHRQWAAEHLQSSERLAANAYPKLTIVGKIAPPIAKW